MITKAIIPRKPCPTQNMCLCVLYPFWLWLAWVCVFLASIMIMNHVYIFWLVPTAISWKDTHKIFFLINDWELLPRKHHPCVRTTGFHAYLLLLEHVRYDGNSFFAWKKKSSFSVNVHRFPDNVIGNVIISYTRVWNHCAYFLMVFPPALHL